MAEIALGWLGWTEHQALSTDVNAILVAHEGRIDMFEFVGWVKRAPETVDDASPPAGVTVELFDAMFG